MAETFPLAEVFSSLSERTAQEWEEIFSSFTDEELNTVALIRIIECSNGCAQHLFRDKSPEAFSVEETRKAMNFSMSGIKNWKFHIGDEVVEAKGRLRETLMEVRDLYVGAFKQGKDHLVEPFFRASVASLKAVGEDRIKAAAELLIREIPDTLPPRMVAMGVGYCQGLMQSTPL